MKTKVHGQFRIASGLAASLITIALLCGCQSPSGAFDGPPPPAPVLTSPASGSKEQAVSPILRWHGSTGAVTYRSQVSANSGFSPLVFDDSIITATSRQVGPFSESTTYYWRVNARNGSGTSGWSQIWSFATVSPSIRPPSLTILYIGNSLTYTNDLPATIAGLAALDSGEINYHSVAKPGFALVDHLDGGSDAVDQVIRGKWDFVILQQGPSSLPESRDILIDGTERFDSYIRSVGAHTALYMVWPDKSRFAFFEDVRVSYKLAADTVGGLFMPAGESWLTAWNADPTLALYGPDNFHPSPLGTYLAALVIYERITGRDVRDLPPTAIVENRMLDIPEETVRLLQRAAHTTNERYR